MRAKPTVRDIAAKRIALARVLAAKTAECPALAYEPHHTCTRAPFDPRWAPYARVGRPSGQQQFHQAPHKIRVMAPGNGWGGTSAMALEVDAWMRHTNRWQPTPPWPCVGIWFTPLMHQFSIILSTILRPNCWGNVPQHRTDANGRPFLEWPDGGRLYVGSYDTSWTKYQGVEIDFVAFDEEPPWELWTEMMFRRRGKRKTRYWTKATQTQGGGWMREGLYTPWLEHHNATPGSEAEERAMVEQTHPEIWCWPKGGAHDNPAVDDDDVQNYENLTLPSAKEHKVRLFGGFESWRGDAVFDEDSIEALMRRLPELDELYGAGVDGMLEVA